MGLELSILFDREGSGFLGISEQWKKNWLVRLYRGWNPTQLYRDYFINHDIRIPSLNNQRFNGFRKGPRVFWAVAKKCWMVFQGISRPSTNPKVFFPGILWDVEISRYLHPARGGLGLVCEILREIVLNIFGCWTKNRGGVVNHPKWMSKIMVRKPYFLMDDLGVPHIQILAHLRWSPYSRTASLSWSRDFTCGPH